MTEQSCPELQAFQKNYEVLLDLSGGIGTIGDKAFAAGLITKDIRKKCSDDKLEITERTKCFIDFLERKIPHEPKALDQLAGIISNTEGLEYVGEKLLTTLDGIKKGELKRPIAVTQSQSTMVSRETSILTSRMSEAKLYDSVRTFSTQDDGRLYYVTTPPSTHTHTPVTEKR